MTDTIESLRAKLAEVERERDALIADFSRELDEARKQITDRVMDWARKSGCVYCGEVFDTLGPEGECEARRALYADHTKVCAKHPMRLIEAERDAACAEMRAALTEIIARGQEQRGTGRMIETAEAALARPDLGAGWASPKDTAQMVGALQMVESDGEFGSLHEVTRKFVVDVLALLRKGGG